jgi:hypothetical protein
MSNDRRELLQLTQRNYIKRESTRTFKVVYPLRYLYKTSLNNQLSISGTQIFNVINVKITIGNDTESVPAPYHIHNFFP